MRKQNTVQQGRDIERWRESDLIPASFDIKNFTPKFAQGTRIFLSEKKSYLDFCLNDGELILGHNHRNVVLSAKVALERGINPGVVSQNQILLAHALKAFRSEFEKVFFGPSPVDVLRLAIRLAQRDTNRRKVIVFNECFLSQFLTGEDIDRLTFNDSEQFARSVEKETDIAAILIEPMATFEGLIPMRDEFARQISQTVRAKNIRLIGDLATGTLRPIEKPLLSFDVCVLGGILGGGFGFGAIAGRGAILSALGAFPEVNVVVSPAALRAGYTTVKLLDKRFWKHLCEKGEIFASAIKGELQKGGQICVGHYAGMLCFCRDNGELLPEQQYALTREHFLRNGILIPANRRRPFFVSPMHSKKDLQQFVDVLREGVECGYFN